MKGWIQSRKTQNSLGWGVEAAAGCQVSTKRVEALEAVEADLEYARRFYESWKPGGGVEILRKYNSRLPGFSAVPSISALGLEGERILMQISGASGQLVCPPMVHAAAILCLRAARSASAPTAPRWGRLAD